QRAQAANRFWRIVKYAKTVEPPGSSYNYPALVGLTFEYARSQESRDRFLKAFFRA
ncbi:hypothetical protein QBC38DRAFT_342709, partial [Podospora fimiseda]